MQEPSSEATIRPSAAAGAFYPADANQMRQEVVALLGGSPVDPGPWLAALAPHAGWMYSGRIAAEVFRRIQIPRSVIILCPKHHPGGAQWAVAPYDAWAIPGAEVAADTELAHELAGAVEGLQLDATPHQKEHAIEVQLPILAHLAPRTRVVGITVGKADPQSCVRFAEGMAAVLKEQDELPLLVISSDLNHFATDVENRLLDEMALQALERLDTAGLFEVCRTHNISMCGLTPAIIALETLRRLDGLRQAQRVAYATSADANGDTSRVVGYAGMLFGR